MRETAKGAQPLPGKPNVKLRNEPSYLPQYQADVFLPRATEAKGEPKCLFAELLAAPAKTKVDIAESD
jgi:hypothetical protein